MKLNDLTGKRFGRLTVVSRADDIVYSSGKRIPVWKCLCDCGNTIKVRACNLESQRVDSCGICHVEGVVKELLMQAQGEYHPKGIQNLFYAFARSVSNDILKNPPGSKDRKHAEELLKTAYFENLTGMDGEFLLECLQQQYKKTRHATNGLTKLQQQKNAYYWRQKYKAEVMKNAHE